MLSCLGVSRETLPERSPEEECYLCRGCAGLGSRSGRLKATGLFHVKQSRDRPVGLDVAQGGSQAALPGHFPSAPLHPGSEAVLHLFTQLSTGLSPCSHPVALLAAGRSGWAWHADRYREQPAHTLPYQGTMGIPAGGVTRKTAFFRVNWRVKETVGPKKLWPDVSRETPASRRRTG